MTDERDAWLRDATQWIIGTIEKAGLGSHAKVAPIRERIWGAVLRVETPDRVLFFKAEGQGARHEPVIVTDIAAVQTKLVPDVLAADLERGWLLMADHGSPMWDSVNTAREVEIWEEILPSYASMQRLSIPKIDRWIDAGTPDRRLHLIPALIEDLLTGNSLPLDRSAISATLQDLRSVCEEIAHASFAQGIDHSDLHGGNVLIGRGGPRLVDWGDSCITHPFASLFVTYQHAIAKLPASERSAAARRLRDVYLDAWSDEVPLADLRREFEKAIWIGHIIRSLNFAHQLGDPIEWSDAVAKFVMRWHEQRALLGRDDELILAVASQTE